MFKPTPGGWVFWSVGSVFEGWGRGGLFYEEVTSANPLESPSWTWPGLGVRAINQVCCSMVGVDIPEKLIVAAGRYETAGVLPKRELLRAV